MHEIALRTLPAIPPGRFLTLAAGSARGFWARGERWIAHAGLAQGPAGPAEVSLADSPGRFPRAGETLERIWAGCGEEDGGRIYGGFSFSASHLPGTVWDEFPAARLQLPRVELAYATESHECRLTVRSGTRDDAEGSADRWARALGEEVPRSGGVGGIEARTTGSDRLRWTTSVRRALEAIESDQVKKIVLARAMEVHPGPGLDPALVALTLWEENRSSHAFLFEPAPGHALIGAAPEVLAHRVGDVLRATAVAGSIGVGSTSGETSALAGRLFESAKDRSEHDFVVEDMVGALRELGCAVRRDVEPHVLTLARIQHLETKLEASIPPGTSLLEILAALHPTPAVCGLPRDGAAALLEEYESFQRGWYAGPVGWIDAAGEGIFVPALRCAVVSNGAWRLFAGAGIVAESDPDLEWEETALKFQPVLRALVSAGASSGILGQVA